MGLIDDAKEKFEAAALKTSGPRKKTSLFGKCLASFMISRRDFQDGKVGAALHCLLNAIESCIPLASSSCSLSKIVGDMHSYLAVFPTSLFDKNCEPDANNDFLSNHLDMISRGEMYYSVALEKIKSSMDEKDMSEFLASLTCDRATNILIRAQLEAQQRGLSGTECVSDIKILETFHRAKEGFVDALHLDPLLSPAWCGLGCALIDDPIKAQHAFSRAIELDPACPDSYANLGFLYLENNAFASGAEMCDILTQVSDTPMTWVNRAYQLEKQAFEQGEMHLNSFEQIAAAYRAALQVHKHPFTLLGLAASLRGMNALGVASDEVRWENQSLLQEYTAATSITPPKDVGSWTAGDDDLSDRVNTSTLQSILDIKQQILTEPGRGDFWLKLSKALILDTSDTDADGGMDAARIAARRAASLLLGNLTEGSSHVANRPMVKALELSDALSLDSWLNSDETAACKKQAQLALLICPQNTLARELLTSHEAAL